MSNWAEAAAPFGFDQTRLQRVADFLQQSVDQGVVPGVALGLARHGQRLPTYTAGCQYLRADSPPIQPDTIFLVASITKPVVATAVLLLLEQGHFLLDDPVASIVPEFASHGKTRVTIRHLLTHTSGLPDMLPTDRQLRGQNAPLSEFIRQICELPLDFAPGTRIQYQSTGIAMLGVIVERVARMPLRDFLRRELFEPLAMSDTALGAGGLAIERIAEVNVPEEMVGTSWGWNTDYWRHFGAPWGGMFSTVNDILNFAQLFLDQGVAGGRQLLSPATAQAMTADQTGVMASLSSESRATQSWGLGWRRQPASRGETWGNLLSPGSFGHGGATGTVLWVDPSRDLSCAIFTTQPGALNRGWLARCSNLVAAAALA